MIANIRKLRSDTKHILGVVGRGDSVIITHHGKPCAKISPYSEEQTSSSTTQTPVFGMWKDHKTAKNVKTFIDDLRKPRHAD